MNSLIQEAYDLYEQNSLDEFLDKADTLLDTNLSHYHRVRLLTMMGSACADPGDTADYYDMASREFQLAKAYHDENNPDEELALENLRVSLGRLQQVVLREAAEDTYGDADDEKLVAPPTSLAQLDGPADAPDPPSDSEPKPSPRALEHRVRFSRTHQSDHALKQSQHKKAEQGKDASKPPTATRKSKYPESKTLTGEVKRRRGQDKIQPQLSIPDLQKRNSKDQKSEDESQDERSMQID